MKKFLSSFPKRDLFFIGAILLALLAFVFFGSSVEIRANYDEKVLEVTSPRLNIEIPHGDVAAVVLTELPELGTPVEGYKHESYCTGVWKNDAWGEYDLCVLPGLPRCIVVTLKNDRRLVFTCTDEEKTETLYESYTAYLRENQYI